MRVLRERSSKMFSRELEEVIPIRLYLAILGHRSWAPVFSLLVVVRVGHPPQLAQTFGVPQICYRDVKYGILKLVYVCIIVEVRRHVSARHLLLLKGFRGLLISTIQWVCPPRFRYHTDVMFTSYKVCLSFPHIC